MPDKNKHIAPPPNCLLPCKGRRFVISDIHGLHKTLKKIIFEKIKLTTNDQLFLLGDYINRGPKSKKVLKLLLKLQSLNYQIYPLRGNHEEMLLNILKTNSEENLLNFLKRHNSTDLLKNGTINEKYIKYLSTLPYYYELDKFYLVHAGFNFNLKNPFEDHQSMLWLRNFGLLKNINTDKTIIHGHQPTSLKRIIKNVKKHSKIIALDNGACYTKNNPIYNIDLLGNLCCLNIDTFELIIQPNIDVPKLNKHTILSDHVKNHKLILRKQIRNNTVGNKHSTES